jgi:hypothetical protein
MDIELDAERLRCGGQTLEIERHATHACEFRKSLGGTDGQKDRFSLMN